MESSVRNIRHWQKSSKSDE